MKSLKVGLVVIAALFVFPLPVFSVSWSDTIGNHSDIDHLDIDTTIWTIDDRFTHSLCSRTSAAYSYGRFGGGLNIKSISQARPAGAIKHSSFHTLQDQVYILLDVDPSEIYYIEGSVTVTGHYPANFSEYFNSDFCDPADGSDPEAEIVYGEYTENFIDSGSGQSGRVDFSLWVRSLAPNDYLPLYFTMDAGWENSVNSYFGATINSLKVKSTVKHRLTVTEWLEQIYNSISGKTQEGEDLGFRNPVVDSQLQEGNVGQDKIDAFESDVTKQFESSFTDLNLEGFKITGGTLSALSFLSTWVMNFFNASGDLQLILLLPLFIGLALLLIGRGAVAMVRVRSQQQRKNNNKGSGG